MSREERRQYQRQMKGMDRAPALPPAARARAERNAARRSARQRPATPAGAFTRRFWIVTILIALALGYIAFSLQWPKMPIALYVGLAVTAVALGAQVGFRWLRGRMPAR